MSAQKNRPSLVLVHGWGLNSAVWQPLMHLLENDFDCLSIDMPGYGANSHQKGASDIQTLADELLGAAPENAHWCAWSLAGMAALVAALKQPGRFKSLSLLCTTPRFTQAPDWEIGMDMSIFETFSAELESDYQAGIQKFLLLQAGAGSKARSLAMEATRLLKKHPAPSPETLSSGLKILKNSDLRNQLADIRVPCQVISGRRDRVVHPKAGERLSELIPDSEYQLLNSGHAPLLSCPDELASLLLQNSSLSQAHQVVIKR